MRTLRTFIILILVAQFLPQPAPAEEAISTIAFGSCAREDREQPIWESIVAQRPELFLFIGDNVYVDIPEPPTSMGDFAAAYRALAAKPGYQLLLATCPILATWDDHDFGLNDSGVEFPLKKGAQQMLLTFFEERADSPRWRREGVYGSWEFGPEGRRVQVLLLDTRYFRDALRRKPVDQREEGSGPYLPHTSNAPTLLGDEQWAWLEQELSKPADVRLIGSSIQVVASEHGWEGWCNFPHERRRLYELIGRTGAGGVLFLSGDRHLIEISRDEEPGTPYPMIDFTSSGFNWGENQVDEPNRFRVGPVLRRPNFGVIRIDWRAQPVSIKLEGLGGDGQRLLEHTVTLDLLRAR